MPRNPHTAISDQHAVEYQDHPLACGHCRDFNMILLDGGIAENGPSRNATRLISIWGTLKRHLLWWCQSRGLWSIALEIRSCYRRIQLERKSRWATSGLALEQIRTTVPQLTFPRNCSETLSYSLSIQALEKERPYLTLVDSELFAQAWFQASRWFAHRSGTECNTRVSDPIGTSVNDEMLNGSEQFSNTPNVIG
jgi:hypothetical protein